MSIEDGDIVRFQGMPVLSAARTWVELSRSMSLQRFVAVTDYLLSYRCPLVELVELTEIALRFTGTAGAAIRRRALDLYDSRAESPRESMIRVVLVCAGLPRPECNVNIYDGARFVARVDMLYAEARLIIEYDGNYHNDPAQWSRDQVRRAELESLGYRVTIVSARDFDDPPQLIARIRRLLAA